MDAKLLHHAQRATLDFYRCFVGVSFVRVLLRKWKLNTITNSCMLASIVLKWLSDLHRRTHNRTCYRGWSNAHTLTQRGERFTLTYRNLMLQIHLVRSSSLSRGIQYSVIIPVFWQISDSNGLRGGWSKKKKRKIFHLSLCRVHLFSLIPQDPLPAQSLFVDFH